MSRLFRSFLQAGFECSTHKLRSGKRLDLVASTRHDEFLSMDYARLRDYGIATVREGIRWTRIERNPGQLDFQTVRPFLQAAIDAKIEIIWDILHFGWPDHLDVFSDAWGEGFAELAEAFARLLFNESPPPYFIAPVNEISFLAWAGGDDALLNPFARNRGHELKARLVKAFVAAVNRVRAVLPNVTIVSPEPVIHIIGKPEVPGAVEQAARYRQSMFEAWDMILGRSHPELGGAENHVDVLGVNFYDRNEWWDHGPPIRRGEPEYRPFNEILAEVYERYRRPVFVSETGTEGPDRPGWFSYISQQTRAAIGKGIPVQGICLYPILNHPGWEDDRHCPNGLWDFASDSGDRKIYEPLAQEIRRQEHLRLAKGNTI